MPYNGAAQDVQFGVGNMKVVVLPLQPHCHDGTMVAEVVS